MTVNSKNRWDRSIWPFVGVPLVCLAIRAIILLTYSPVEYGDTGRYVELAHQIREMNVAAYLGIRTPVYPVLLVLAGFDYRSIWIIQSSLGIATSLALFVLSWRLTHNSYVSALIGIACGVALNSIFFEAAILTETLSAFLVVVSVLTLAQAYRSNGRDWGSLVLASVTAAMAGLTRPALLFLGPLYFVWVAVAVVRAAELLQWKIGRLIVFVAPWLSLALGWCAFNWATLDYFGPTTLTGYNLMNHTGTFIEYAPDEYAQIKSVYLKYRERQIAEAGTQSMTIHHAADEMLQVTGLSYVGLSKALTRMSLELIVRQPRLYLASVDRAWQAFWDVPIYWELSQVRAPQVAHWLTILWNGQQRLLTAANSVFLLLVPVLAWRVFKRRGPVAELKLIVVSGVLAGSVFQALFEYGENARYAFPFQPLVLCVVLVELARYGREALAAASASPHN